MTKTQSPKPKPNRWLSRQLGISVLLGIWVLVFGISAGCAKARAQTVPDGPPLSVPTPPDRVIVPPEEPVLAAIPPTEAPGPGTPSTGPVPQVRPPLPSAPAAAVTTPPPVAPPVVEPARPSPPTAADLASERRIREILRRATRDTGRLTYNRLSAAGRSQYDQSKSLSEQAELAIKDRNWVFAETLADKAATLAAELVR
jgi:hypothetical protein